MIHTDYRGWDDEGGLVHVNFCGMKPEVASESSGSLEDPPGPLVKPACVDGMACICARWVSTPTSLPSLLPQRKKKKKKKANRKGLEKEKERKKLGKE